MATVMVVKCVATLRERQPQRRRLVRGDDEELRAQGIGGDDTESACVGDEVAGLGMQRFLKLAHSQQQNVLPI
eukprot:6196896-Pleurochrysis_carterae.AAC.2